MRILFIFILATNLSFLSYSQNLLPNGDFENGTTNWSYWADNSLGYGASFQITTAEVYSGAQSGEVRVDSVGVDMSYYKVMVRNNNFSLEAGKSYHVSFFLKSDQPSQEFVVHLHQDSSPYTTYYSEVLTATTTWQSYSFDFIAPVTTSDVRWSLKVGQAVATYYFDDVSIVENGVSYTSVIDPAISMDWSEAGRPNGIPFVPNSLNVKDFGAIGDGLADDLASFQQALSQANYGEAVFVPAGEYLIGGMLSMPEGVVLRGECPSTTTLNFDLGGTSDDCISIVTYEYGTFTDVSGAVSKGTTSLTVADPSNFVVGSFAELQQENDSLLMYTDPNWIQSWSEQSMGQLFVVQAINGNEIVLDRPLYVDFNPSLSPQLRPIGLIEDVGIENLKINRLDAGDGNTIELKNAARCWVRNVESNMTYRAHIHLDKALDCEIRENYFHHSHDYGGGGHGYGVDLHRHSTSNLVENNIFEHLRHAMLIQVGATGNVFGYNYSFDPFWSNSTTNLPPDISMHGHYPTMNLFEGNIVQEATFSDYWGPVGPGNTMYRNRVETSEIRVADHSHYQTIVGNELTDGSSFINIENTVQNTWFHSNNANGSTINTTSESLPASLYKKEVPDFFYGLSYPSIGPEFSLGSGTIPVKERFDIGEIMLLCRCNPQGFPCYPNDSLQLNLKVWLEGAYVNDSMRSDLNEKGLLPGQRTIDTMAMETPAGHPYTSAPWNYSGDEGLTFNDFDYEYIERLYGQSVVDWLLLSFRSQPEALSLLGKSAALLLSDGQVIILRGDAFLSTLPSPFYILIEHRNHTAVMSNTTLSFLDNSIQYDFSAQAPYLGYGAKEINTGIWGMLSGDGDQTLDASGYDINSVDRVLFENCNGLFNKYLSADFNLDGEVNGADKILWSVNNGLFFNLERE